MPGVEEGEADGARTVHVRVEADSSSTGGPEMELGCHERVGGRQAHVKQETATGIRSSNRPETIKRLDKLQLEELRRMAD